MLIIAGPCALESRNQLRECLKFLSTLNIDIIRASLWKPRTIPGWDGLGELGLPMLLEETFNANMVPATEIISAEHAHNIVNALKPYGDDVEMLVWIGARNQNHFEIRKIGMILSDAPSGVKLMFKNQLWVDRRHWLGTCLHLLDTGFPKSRLLTCHRGFNPGYGPNDGGLRNVPDFEMAISIKNETQIPLIIDPSHMAGDSQKVHQIIEEAKKYPVDGYMIECHNDVSNAKTDANQQLSFSQVEEVIKAIRDYRPVFA